MILKDRRATIRYVAECMKLSSVTTHHIIADVLGYNKLCARWVPRMLTAEIMHVWMQTSDHNLELYRAYISWQVSSSICDHGWKLGSPFWSGNETTEHAVEAPHITSSGQVSQDRLGQQGYGVCVLGQWRSSVYWLLRERQDCHRCLLCWANS